MYATARLRLHETADRVQLLLLPLLLPLLLLVLTPVMLHFCILDDKASAAVRSRKELCTTLLARKHPVAYFQFLDCCTRSGQCDAADAARICNLAVVGSTKTGSKGLEELLSSRAATAALASALTSIVKRFAQQLRSSEAAAAAAGDGDDKQVFLTFVAPAKMPVLLLGQVSHLLCQSARVNALAGNTSTVTGSSSSNSNSSNSSSSSSSRTGYEQQRASTLLLLVLICRSLVVLHEALLQLPQMSGLGLDAQMRDAAAPIGEAAQVQQVFVVTVWQMFSAMYTALHICLRTQEAVALTAVDAARCSDSQAGTGHTASRDATTSSSSSSGKFSSSSSSSSSSREPSSSSSQRVRWQYLLRLHESRKLMTALPSLLDVWNNTSEISCSTAVGAAEQLSSSSFPAAVDGTAAAGSSEKTGLSQQQLQQFYAILQFCRVLVSVAPLPVVCNNPGCVQLGGASEAAAARFMCAGCGCRYCSAACQAAGWRGHKKACRRMGDCGMRV
jgi:hypothetical protein